MFFLVVFSSVDLWEGAFLCVFFEEGWCYSYVRVGFWYYVGLDKRGRILVCTRDLKLSRFETSGHSVNGKAMARFFIVF